nr:uncharacterized protein LOC114823121 [Malus domestica]
MAGMDGGVAAKGIRMMVAAARNGNIGLDEFLNCGEVSNLLESNSESSWGNKFGMFLLPIYYHKSSDLDPLVYLKRAKLVLDSFTISNILGPQEAIAIGGNLVTYLKVNTCSLPQALIMHMVSYAERANLQILVAKDIFPDTTFLAKCFEEALLDMKEAASSHE